MTYLYYDGSFEGFLCAVFEVYYLKLKEVSIQPHGKEQNQLFANTIRVPTNEERARRVASKITEVAGASALSQLWRAILSEREGIEDSLLRVIHYLLREKRDIMTDFGNKHVLTLRKTLQKVNRERHRMTAFVRFEQATDGVYYATVEPDFDVLPLIKDHFRKRYADQRWLIFDGKRKYGIFYDLETVICVEPESGKEPSHTPALSIQLSETEENFQKLWQQYFQSTGITSRKNNRLHLQHVPKRYWKHLTEKKNVQ